MLRLSDSCVRPYYLLWGRTRDVYVCTTKFLLGASEEVLNKQHPGLRWVVKNLSRSVPACAIAKANHYRSLLLSGDKAIEVEATEFVETMHIRDVGDLSVALRAVVLQNISDVYKFYPPEYHASSKLRNVLAGYKYVGSVVIEGPWAGCFLSGSPSRLTPVTTDSELAELCGLPVSVVDCGFTEDSVILVDGENIVPFELDVFLKSVVPVKLRRRILVKVFCDQGMKKQWDFVQESSGANIVVHTSARIENRKSLVDFDLLNEFNRLYYEAGYTDFYVMSSDSDFGVIAKQFKDASVTYIVRDSNLGAAWRTKVASLGRRVIFIDESCNYWNYGVFLSAFVVNAALGSSEPVWDHEDSWDKFVEEVGLAPTMKVCSVARERVQRIVYVQKQRLLSLTKGVMV